PPGASAEIKRVVDREMTVAHYHDHMPEVFGTPFMIYLMEVAAADAIQPYLPEGWVSVGVVVNVKHLAATPVGDTVIARARVTAVTENTVSFEVEAYDSYEKIGEGTHVRAPINLERFSKRVSIKSKRDVGAD
ncbi:MAG TPA: hotdog domain-containing protein, partial [Blastocatellia bacterium]|nr:hotdog domain-containing protein [Blastocatellia bacterium]